MRLLRRASSFRSLFLATLASGLGTRLAVIALMVDVYDRTHSGKWIAALLVADFLPLVAIGLLLGPLVDRVSRRWLMIGSDLARAAVFVALPFADDPATIVALAAVVGFATGLFRPAVFAGLPNLVDDEDLPHANSLLHTIENLTWMLGPLAGGVILAASGPSLAYWINAATFVLSAALIARIPERLLQSAKALSDGHWRDLAAGFRLVRSSRALVTVLVAWTVVMLANANYDVAEVELAKDVFDSGDFGLGLLMAAAGLGLVMGSLPAALWVERRPVGEVYSASLALMAGGVALAAVSPNVWVAAVFATVFGIGNGAALVANGLLVQRGAPDHMRGRAFTLIWSVNFVALAIGMGLAGAFTDAVGARIVWGTAAALLAVAAALAYVLSRSIGEPAVVPAGGEGPERAEVPELIAPVGSGERAL